MLHYIMLHHVTTIASYKSFLSHLKSRFQHYHYYDKPGPNPDEKSHFDSAYFVGHVEKTKHFVHKILKLKFHDFKSQAPRKSL